MATAVSNRMATSGRLHDRDRLRSIATQRDALARRRDAVTDAWDVLAKDRDTHADERDVEADRRDSAATPKKLPPIPATRHR